MQSYHFQCVGTDIPKTYNFNKFRFPAPLFNVVSQVSPYFDELYSDWIGKTTLIGDIGQGDKCV
jgi:acetone carboxylase gamma subunit